MRRSAYVRLLACLVIAAGSFTIYLSNGEYLASYDSTSNSLLAFNLFATKQLTFDDYRGGYFDTAASRYAFVETPSGHRASVFPIGTAILTFPIAVVYWFVARPSGAAPPSAAFEPVRERFEKTAAALLAAITVVLFFLCARDLGSPLAAATATAIFAFATPMWAIASQALWQQGPVNCALLAAIFGVQRALHSPGNRSGGWLMFAGIFAGLLPVIRPPALLFTVALLAFVAVSFRRHARWFIIASAVAAAPGALWNLWFFHSLVGGYAINVAGYTAAVPAFLGGLAGLLASPSRGLFIFSPILLFALGGYVIAWRKRDPDAALLLTLAAAAVIMTIQYAFFRQWWSGFTYGPRFLTDTVAVAALLIVYVIPSRVPGRASSGASRTLAVLSFVAAFGISVIVQFVGVNSGAPGSDWNAVPISIDDAPARLWSIRDNQIERNLLAVYDRVLPKSTPSTANVSVRSCMRGNPKYGVPTLVAEIANTGSSAVFGYRSGRYTGQLRVHVRIYHAGALIADDLLYSPDTLAPGQSSTAFGAADLPTAAGSYNIACNAFLVGDEPIVSKPLDTTLAVP